MAMTLEEFIAASGAEIVADRLIVGQMGDRRFVGDVLDGTFTLNDAGKDLLATLEAPAQARIGRRKAADAPAPETPDQPVE